MDKKAELSGLPLFVRYKARIGFFSKPNNLLPALSRAAALQECPCGAFWAQRARYLQGLPSPRHRFQPRWGKKDDRLINKNGQDSNFVVPLAEKQHHNILMLHGKLNGVLNMG
ncbi:MAG: hypothetical protein HQL80_05625 [Magnetococcales bacterium]|nr:hypothetical protein [Magnetococcales bacterium]